MGRHNFLTWRSRLKTNNGSENSFPHEPLMRFQRRLTERIARKVLVIKAVCLVLDFYVTDLALHFDYLVICRFCCSFPAYYWPQPVPWLCLYYGTMSTSLLAACSQPLMVLGLAINDCITTFGKRFWKNIYVAHYILHIHGPSVIRATYSITSLSFLCQHTYIYTHT